jgi:hypothetical protein
VSRAVRVAQERLPPTRIASLFVSAISGRVAHPGQVNFNRGGIFNLRFLRYIGNFMHDFPLVALVGRMIVRKARCANFYAR